MKYGSTLKKLKENLSGINRLLNSIHIIGLCDNLLDKHRYVEFAELNVKDPFFSSLIADYEGFEDWFAKKSVQREKAYILNENGLLGFLYLKEEDEEDHTITPKFDIKRRLKVGTFKVEAHGTVLGERFMGILLKEMIEENYPEAYVTVFEKQESLIKLFEKFGFSCWGHNKNGELVYTKSLDVQDDTFKDFPRIQTHDKNKFLLSIYPKYHTRLFPNSKLQTEKSHKVEDLSFTNTIEKVYLAGMRGMDMIKSGDLMVIYRTREQGKAAEWSSVATSICTVLDIKHIREFQSFDDFVMYCGKGTIFTIGELRNLWYKRRYPHIVKMLYNISLAKRIVRHDLIEEVDIERGIYSGFVKLTNDQFQKIIELGEVNESFIIN